MGASQKRVLPVEIPPPFWIERSLRFGQEGEKKQAHFLASACLQSEKQSFVLFWAMNSGITPGGAWATIGGAQDGNLQPTALTQEEPGWE